MKKLIPLIVTSLLIASGAEAGVAVNLMGGLNFNKNSVTPASATNTVTAKSAVSYGATIEFGLAPMFAIETGILSIGRKNKVDVAGAGEATISSRGIEIPVMVRFTLLPVLDFGVGGYYGKGNSTFTVSGSTISGYADGEHTVDQTQTDLTDYGARASVRAKLPIAPMAKILFDGSYTMGLKDVDKTAATTEKTREYALMAGVSLGF